jgi:hypothetical protein
VARPLLTLKKSKVTDVFVDEMMVEIPCCSCCGSDEGYVDAIMVAVEKLELQFTPEQQKRMDSDFLSRLTHAP